MGLKNSGSNTTACINRHIGTAYDKVAIVADNIDEVKAIGSVMGSSFKYLGASDVPPSVRLDGSVIQNGDYYFDSVNDSLAYYDLDSNGWFVVVPEQVEANMVAAALSETNAKASELLARTSASTTVTKATEAAVSASEAYESVEYARDIIGSVHTNTWGDRYVGTFTEGFIYTGSSDVGLGQDGKYYSYVGSDPFPVTVAAGTIPSTPNYTLIKIASAYTSQWQLGKSVGYALDDYAGTDAELFAQAGIVPNGQPDKLGASQRVDAIKQLEKAASKVTKVGGGSIQDFIDSFALKIFQSPTNGGLTEIQTRTVNANEVYEVRKTSDNSLATIYSDAAGTTEIVQNGTSNVSDSAGVVEFYIADGDYTIEVDSVEGRFKTSRLPSGIIATAVHIADLGIENGITTNHRDLIYSQNKPIFVPDGFTFKCDLLPDDDVTIFLGGGSFSTTDIFGNTHTFDIEKMNNGTGLTASNVINKAVKLYKKTISVGCLGDSITDGADSSGWSPNPIDVDGNLSSTNYNHNLNGGANSWFRTFTSNINDITNEYAIDAYNISSSGKRLFDGWAYRNFDYGFFQNAAYGNKAPDVLYVAMGVNDSGRVYNDITFEKYMHEFEKIIKKARGYGCAVAFISVNTVIRSWRSLEDAIKSKLELTYKDVEYVDLSKELNKYRLYSNTTFELWRDSANNYETTHPKTDGHRFIGAAMTKAVINGIFETRKGFNFTPQTNSDVRVTGYPSGDVYPVNIVDVSGGHLDQLKSLPISSPASENVTLTYYFWCEEPNTSMVCLEPLVNTYTKSERSNTIRVRLNDRRATEKIYNAGSRNIDTFSDYKTSKINQLGYGLNIVSIIYDGAPSRVYIPTMLFREYRSVATIPFSTRILQAGASKPITLFGSATEKGIMEKDYQPSSSTDEMPDNVESKNYDYISTVRLLMSNGTGIVVGGKVTASKGTRVIKQSNTELTISDYSGALVQTVTGDFSGDCTIQSQVAPADTIAIVIIDTLGSTTIVNISGSTGGAILAANDSASNARITIYGGSLQID